MARAASVQSTARKNVLRRRQTPTSRPRRKRTAARIKLPEGGHEAVLRSEPHHPMVMAWTDFADQFERLVFEVYGVGSFPVAEVVPVIAYASVARMAFALCSAAEIAKGFFDPVEFGQSCERIAREQIERYRFHLEKAGRA
jgi:hypothetical protein